MPSRKKKPFYNKILVSFVFITALSTGGYFLFIWWMEKQAGFAHYPAFGISLPIDYAIHGIDVSTHQGVISWDDVQQMKVKDVELKFAIIKATEGYTRVDWQFKRNWKRAKEVGMARGAYHFFLATKNGEKQAENFIATVNLEQGDLPPVLDVEETYGVKPADLKKRLKEWLDAIENHYKVKPIIYTNVDFYQQYLGTDFDSYPLWVAHYIEKNRPRIERKWILWQHSEKGRVNGVVSAVDFNVFNGDSAEFNQLLVH
jgi:lysozyme